MSGQHKTTRTFRIVICLLTMISSLALPTPMPGSAQPIQFGDPAFATQWNYSDKAVNERRVNRSWLWGPSLLTQRVEPFVGSPAHGNAGPDYHLVQYFDKGRMEFAPDAGGQTGMVTNGRLIVEMMSGDIQVGLRNNEYFTIRPARLAIAGDREEGRVHPNTATYASLYNIATIGGAGTPAQRVTPGTRITASYTRHGNIRTLPTGAVPSNRIPTVQLFFPENDSRVSGHNIPNVFINFLTQNGSVWSASQNRYITAPLFANWVTAVGLPITEPYWTQVRINGNDSWVMFQAFERRILTYNPSNNDPTWQVEMGNVGQHYMAWRPEPLQKPTVGGALVVRATLYNTQVCPSYRNNDYADNKCLIQPLQDPEPSITTLLPQSWARTQAGGSMLLQTDNTIYDMQPSSKLVFKRIENSADGVTQENGWIDYMHEPKKRITVETSTGLVEAIDTRFSVIVTGTAELGEAQLRIVVPPKGGSVTLQLLPSGPNLPVPPPIIVPSASTLTAIKGQENPDIQPISGNDEQYWNEKVNRLQNIPGLEEVTRLGEVIGPRLVLAYYQPSLTFDDWKSGNTSDVPDTLYESSSLNTLRSHIITAWRLGIDGFTSEWTAAGTQGDQNLNRLLGVASDLSSGGYFDEAKQQFYPDLKVGIYFNMNIVLSQPDLTATQGVSPTQSISPTQGLAFSHVERAIRAYAGHPSYLRWGGKPVFFFRNVEAFRDLESWRQLRDRIDPERVHLWVVDSTDTAWLKVFDGLNLLDGNLKDDASQMLTVNQEVRSAIDRYNNDKAAQRLWIAGVVPGRDTRNLKVGNRPNPNPRVLDRNEGNTYDISWSAAINSGADWVVINSFNDWYQGTQIEPSASYGNRYFDLTSMWSWEYKTGLKAPGQINSVDVEAMHLSR